MVGRKLGGSVSTKEQYIDHFHLARRSSKPIDRLKSNRRAAACVFFFGFEKEVFISSVTRRMK
jgi:hypothetical protein